MNRIVTIPRPEGISKTRELVLISKREYELLLERSARALPEISLTMPQKKMIAESEKELRAGRYVTLTQLRHGLERTSTRTRR